MINGNLSEWMKAWTNICLPLTIWQRMEHCKCYCHWVKNIWSTCFLGKFSNFSVLQLHYLWNRENSPDLTALLWGINEIFVKCLEQCQALNKCYRNTWWWMNGWCLSCIEVFSICWKWIHKYWAATFSHSTSSMPRASPGQHLMLQRTSYAPGSGSCYSAWHGKSVSRAGNVGWYPEMACWGLFKAVLEHVQLTKSLHHLNWLILQEHHLHREWAQRSGKGRQQRGSSPGGAFIMSLAGGRWFQGCVI